MADEMALLLRRLGFGPTPVELTAATQAGYDPTATSLTRPSGADPGAVAAPVPQLGPDPSPRLGYLTAEERARVDTKRGEQIRTLTRWWLDRMTVAQHQGYEKMVYFWHGHWATSVKKVLRPQLMLTQHLTLRSAGDFTAMAHRMVADPALIFWLDGELNTRSAPNENLARELMELFTLGIGNYTEQDVKEAGRALTGWRIDYDAAVAHLSVNYRDPGKKTILGMTSDFDAASLVDLLVKRPECPRFLAARLWLRYASSTEPIPPATQSRMVAAFPDTAAMLRAMVLDDAFQATANRLVKQPVEWFVGAVRQLSLRPADLTEGQLARVMSGLERMGQLPFAPRSVGGWPSGAAWLTAGAAQARLNLAALLAELAGPDDRTPEDLALQLVVNRWSDRTYAILRQTSDPAQRLVLALCSPEYLVT